MSTATEGGHYYEALTGLPKYTVIGKNGKERATTLRDARTLNLVPSVTTISKMMDKPGLNNWREKQILLAALTLPRIEGETDDAFADRVLADAQAQAKQARDNGTAVHGAIELYCQGKAWDAKYDAHVAAVSKTLSELGIAHADMRPEKSFAHALRYGGKVDLHTTNVVVDFKTKDRIEDGKKYAYDEHCIQLAAYRFGFELPLNAPCYNLFIGVQDAKVVVHEWSQQDLLWGQSVFFGLLDVWKRVNRFGEYSE